jgi:hypothetical protein
MFPYQDHCVLSSFTEETGRHLGCQQTFDPHRYRYSLDIDLVVQSFLTFIHLRFMEDGLPDSYSRASCFFPATSVSISKSMLFLKAQADGTTLLGRIGDRRGSFRVGIWGSTPEFTLVCLLFLNLQMLNSSKTWILHV